YSQLMLKKAQQGEKFSTKNEVILTRLAKQQVRIGDDLYSMPETVNILLDNMVMGNGIHHEMMDKARYSTGLSTATKDRLLIKEYDTVMKKIWGSNWNPIGTDDYMSKAGQWASGKIEEGMARIPHFLHQTRAGVGMSEAGRRVNHMFVDYGRLSKGERAIRTYLIPFYTWQSKMVGVMLGVTAMNPVYMSTLTKIQNNAYKMLDLNKRLDSTFEQETEGIPALTTIEDIGKFISGKDMDEIDVKFLASERFMPQTVVNLVNIRTPLDLLNPIKYAEGLSAKLLTDVSPIVKYPLLELPLGVRLRGLMPFSKHLGDKKDIMGLPVSGELKHILFSLTSTFRIVDDFSKTWRTNSYTGNKLPMTDFLIKNMLGFKAYDKHESIQVYNYIKELQSAYEGHVRSGKYKKDSLSSQQYHFGQALQMRYGLDALKWLEKYILEHQDADRYQFKYGKSDL
ncbi:MAG: hypothetical protein KAS32_11275, partial [Candidatus Peribacteraceae bacterium]|nr:hypothetical protein [Candidatus Peribacteraceae bacterium]